MAVFTTVYDEKIRPLMDKIDQARTLLAPSHYGITFPNVIVVGDQSSGKSSLLESLSLVELPKGNGIVTRCPLVLRLRKSNERCVYRLYDDNRRVLLDEGNLVIPRYIEEETKKLAGDHKNIVQDMIELLVEDPSVRDLTLVDLPGIAHNPIDGQPDDIYDQTVNLIRQFIRQEGSVILCVFPANVDIATVQSFKLAREVDPLGKRTIGVITKSDLASDQDTLVQQLLMDRHDVLHLKLGFVAVRNRNTKESIALQEAHEKEKEFFSKHPASTAAGWNCVGINALINRLANVYSECVKETFPKLRKDIRARLEDVVKEMSKLPPNFQTSAERIAVYNEIVDLYVEKILKPTLMGSNIARQVTIVNILHQKFENYRIMIRKQRTEFFSNEYRSKIAEEMKIYAGEQLPNFLPSSILKQSILKKLDELWTETEKLINDCFRTTVVQLRKAEDKASKDNVLLSKLMSKFQEVSTTYIDEKKKMVLYQLKELIQLDQNEPYTNNTAYMHIFEKYKGPLAYKSTASFNISTQAVASPVDYSDDENDVLTYKQSSSDGQAVQQMLLSIYSYWKFLTKRFTDYTTLSLRAGCVFTLCPAIQQRLRRVPIEHSYFVEICLTEDEFIRNKRIQLNKTKETLEKVYKILHEEDTMVAEDLSIDLVEFESDSTLTTGYGLPTSAIISPPSLAQVAQSSPQTIQKKTTPFVAPVAQTTINFSTLPTSSPFTFGTTK